jgi:hypothetical protein
MKKSQRQPTSAVRNDHDQGGSPAAHDGGMFNFSLHQDAGARVQRSNGVKPGPVLVAKREVEQ